MTFSWHSFSGNCRSHCVEANLAWFHTLSRWSHQMPKSKHPVREQVTSQRLCLNVTQSKPAHRPLGSQTAHRRSRVIWPWHIIVRVRLCVCVRVCDVWSVVCIQETGHISALLSWSAHSRPLFTGWRTLVASWQPWLSSCTLTLSSDHLCHLCDDVIQLRYDKYWTWTTNALTENLPVLI